MKENLLTLNWLFVLTCRKQIKTYTVKIYLIVRFAFCFYVEID